MLKIDQLIRSNRKTVALIITAEGKFIVRAPQRTTKQQIEDIVAQKAGWIKKKQAQVAQRAAQNPAKKGFTEGETFLFLGKPYPLALVDRASPPLSLESGGFTLSKNDLPRAKDLFIDWYRQQARFFITERVNHFADKTGLRPTTVKITSATTRWGSCSSRGTLSFPWRLIMAPLPVIDYVIIHELAHIQIKNHSPRYWQKVAQLLPAYRQHIEWLKANGHTLTLD